MAMIAKAVLGTGPRLLRFGRKTGKNEGATAKVVPTNEPEGVGGQHDPADHEEEPATDSPNANNAKGGKFKFLSKQGTGELGVSKDRRSLFQVLGGRKSAVSHRKSVDSEFDLENSEKTEEDGKRGDKKKGRGLTKVLRRKSGEPRIQSGPQKIMIFLQNRNDSFSKR